MVLYFLIAIIDSRYLARRVMQKDVVVQGNPKVYKALKTQMEQLHAELLRLSNASDVNDEFMDLLDVVTKI